MTWGIRYLVIAVGTPDMPCEEKDMDELLPLVQQMVRPLTVTKLSESASNRLTVVLLNESGSLGL
jgi:hypothetical protein